MAQLFNVTFEDTEATNFGFDTTAGTDWSTYGAIVTDRAATGNSSFRWQSAGTSTCVAMDFGESGIEEIYLGFHIWFMSGADVSQWNSQPYCRLETSGFVARGLALEGTRTSSGSGDYHNVRFDMNVSGTNYVDNWEHGAGADRWYWVQLYYKGTQEAGQDGCELRVDGETVASTSGVQAGAGPIRYFVIPSRAHGHSPNHGAPFYLDNIIARTDTWPTEPTDVRLPQYIYGWKV